MSKQPRLILCCDYLNIVAEIRRQLRSYGLSVKVRKANNHSDFVIVTVNNRTTK